MKVTLSSKYQIVIPKEIREGMDLKAGRTMEILSDGQRIELIPLGPISSLKGMFPGIDTRIDRDEDRL